MSKAFFSLILALFTVLNISAQNTSLSGIVVDASSCLLYTSDAADE